MDKNEVLLAIEDLSDRLSRMTRTLSRIHNYVKEETREMTVSEKIDAGIPRCKKCGKKMTFNMSPNEDVGGYWCWECEMK